MSSKFGEVFLYMKLLLIIRGGHTLIIINMSLQNVTDNGFFKANITYNLSCYCHHGCKEMYIKNIA